MSRFYLSAGVRLLTSSDSFKGACPVSCFNWLDGGLDSFKCFVAGPARSRVNGRMLSSHKLAPCEQVVFLGEWLHQLQQGV